MRKITILLLILNAACCLQHSEAQAPQAIPYQAVARDNSGNPIVNQLISLRFTIRNGSAVGTIVYRETQSKTTNLLGLFTANIGQGTVVSGNFTTVDWALGSKFMQVEMDATGGNAYIDMGTQQLLSVPYALNAGNGNWNKTGNNISNSNIGNVGVGNNNPGAKLDVNGQVKISGGTPGTGKVLTSDANGLATWQTISATFEPTYTIGLNNALGGYVFYVTPDGHHGLVAPTQDQGVSSWYEVLDLITNPLNYDSVARNFTNWRLPSRYELYQMYDNRVAIGGFDLTGTAPYFSMYWSATESSLGLAWLILFTNGNQFINDYESNPNRVRAVRSF